MQNALLQSESVSEDGIAASRDHYRIVLQSQISAWQGWKVPVTTGAMQTCSRRSSKVHEDPKAMSA